MAFSSRIELDPRVCNGKAVVKGTRIPVSVILDRVASGDSWDDTVKGFPELKKEDIQAALLYASALLDQSEVREAQAWSSQAVSGPMSAGRSGSDASKRGL